jgi:uncharacterized protein (TIGR03435 family)
MRTLQTVAAFLSLVGVGMAQQFEVASIKPSAPDARGPWIRSTPGGRFTATKVTLKELITQAWRIQPFQISGGPAWIDSNGG